MEQNKLTVVINKSLEDVFEFTVNPKNTPLWIPDMREEICDVYPPKIGTVYKNRGNSDNWDVYIVTEIQKNRLFTLKSSDNNYHVKYTSRKISDNITEVEYCEWVNNGKLSNPFNQAILNNLKKVMEK
jgi:hypothetical protein